MHTAVQFLAFDLGAESGRAIRAEFDGDRLRLQEIHRFPNGPVRVMDSLHWDVLHIFDEIKCGLGLCARSQGRDLASIGIDTWGVDCALLASDGSLLGNPYHYRDPRTDGTMEEAFKRVPKEKIFEYTGIQFMQINTLYQLFSMVLHKSPLLEVADRLLMMPDLFNYWLTGCQVCEFTEATTTQFYDPRKGTWAIELLERLEIPTHILGEIVPPGTILGALLPSVAEETDLGSVPVVAPACHDTGSAVAAVPARSRDYAYISSGTWSLFGAEVLEPVINELTLAHNYTNEGGVCNTFRLLKNIMGLWLFQECRRIWARGGTELSYAEMTEMAEKAPPFGPLIDVDDRAFLTPGDMPSAIQSFCARTGQTVPEDRGAILRCILESLALKYRWALDGLEEILGRRLHTIHIIGGGSRNHLLCQLTADATQRPVIAGPAEATAIGNVLVQALALGHIASLEEGREVVRQSFEVTTYEPGDSVGWDEAYERLLVILGESA